MSTAQPLYLQVDQPAARLDQWLAQSIPQLSRSQLQKLIRQGQVLVAGQPARPSAALQPGDVVTVHLPAPEPAALQPETTPLDVVYEDDDLVVINKPAGMVVHPAQGHTSGTLVNALLARYPDLAVLAEDDSGAADRPGIVHRLDRDTSGLMIVARTPAALRRLQQQFKARTVEKIYLALVFGRPEAAEGIIDVPLGRDPRFRQKIAPRADGKPARTHYRVIEDFGAYSLLEIGLETGRTHQIRVHLAWLKCPVVGDTVYGRKKNALGLKRQFLHAWRLAFQHPRTGETIQLEAPLDPHSQAVLGQLRR
ncbi:MAG: RluA family pseudouridine synthase [Anaerolineae bacterium]|nr:RluA family pseudouridine synthase [Anaerolineae bacterium]